jgi:hypothetical protein
MNKYILDIIPKIKKFSKKLDDLTILTKQGWVSINNNLSTKHTFYFKKNKELIISKNGMVQHNTWEFLHEKIILNLGKEGYILSPVYLDDKFFILKDDHNDGYFLFVNEYNFDNGLKSISSVENFFKFRFDNEKRKLQEKESNKDQEAQIYFLIILVAIILLILFSNSKLFTA